MSGISASPVVAGYARAVGMLACVVGLVVLSGWVYGVAALTRIVGGWPQMAPLTALVIALCGISLFFGAGLPATAFGVAQGQSVLPRLLARSGAGLALVLCLLRLGAYLLGRNLGLDSVGLAQTAAAHGMQPGTMSPATALGYCLLGGPLLLVGRLRWARAHQVSALLALLIGWLGLARYVYGGAPLVPYSQMAIHTALMLMLLALGTLALRQDAGIMALFASADAGGGSLRRLLPAALTVPLAAGALTLYVLSHGWLGVEAGMSLFALSSAMVFAGIVWANAARVTRVEAERHKAQRALQASEERTRLIIEAALDAVITIDAAGIITGWNAQAEVIFGWTRVEAIRRTLSDIIIPEHYREAHRKGLKRYLATGEGPVLNQRFELSALRRDLSEFPVELAITPIRWGERIAFSAFVRDITERKRSDERQRAQLERMHLLDHITRAIGERQDLPSIFQVVIASLEKHLPIEFGCIGLYQPAREALQIACIGVRSQAIALELGLSEQAWIDVDQNGLGRCVKGQLVHESDIARSECPFPARLARGGLRSLVFAPLTVESKVFAVLVAARREAGSFASTDCEFLRQLSEHLALATHQSQLYSALQQAYDDLRQTQQSVMNQERLRTLGQMASGIAHDINNALAPAALYAQSLLECDQSLSQQARGQLAVIQRAIESVAGTVARLREFYRPREQDLALVPVDLNMMLTHVAELTRVRWSDMPQQYGFVIELRAELAPILPKIHGAYDEIQDALTNLVLNAIDAMPAGGILTLRSSLGDTGADPAAAVSDRAWVEVSDTGIGMTEEARLRCMEPFFTTKDEQGAGLGLAMVYGMAQRHSAEFTINSESGKGTRVRLAFPLTPVRKESPLPPLAQAAQPLRILLVDDDPLLLKSLRDFLESDGHSVQTADGGQAGIDQLLAACERAEPFAAVIADLGMPNVDGRAVASVIRAAAPTTHVVLLTGWGHGMQGDKMPEYVYRVLNKPPLLAELRAALADIASARLTSS
jgi:PAS domain S-box-containing protein